jgi:2-polyprenyl-3-methyl-5-hydroxy-6-metoxy-1,4-benzoquinol methylase
MPPSRRTLVTSFFEAYGRLAREADDPTVIAGRHAFQRSEERLIVDDVTRKLELGPKSRLLEIGCGMGVLLGPLSRLVHSATGVDHESIIERAAGRLPDDVRLIAGRWPDVIVDSTFDRILVYSVLHYLDGPTAAEAFVDACVTVLEPGGRILLGDLPNRDAAARFTATEAGAAFSVAWRERVAGESGDDAKRDAIFDGIEGAGYLDDEFILGLVRRYRARGFEAYVLPQRSDLPFGWTREDIVLHRRPA